MQCAMSQIDDCQRKKIVASRVKQGLANEAKDKSALGKYPKAPKPPKGK